MRIYLCINKRIYTLELNLYTIKFSFWKKPDKEVGKNNEIIKNRIISNIVEMWRNFLKTRENYHI